MTRSQLKGKDDGPIEQALFSTFIVGLAWTPLFFGSSSILAWGVNAIIFPCLAAIYEVSILMRGKHHPVALKNLRIPAALFMAVVFWILVQNATWTPSSLHHPIWQLTAEVLGKPVEGSISVNRDLTTLALLRLITAGSVFWIAVQLCRNTSRAEFLVKAILAIASLYAAYGLLSLFLMPGHVFRLGGPPAPHFVTSTFLNQNTFATYAGIGLIAACGLILRLSETEDTTASASLQSRILSFIENELLTAVALLGSALLILVALLLTGSRGGVIATAVGLLLLGILAFGRRKRGSTRQRVTIIVGAVLVAAGFVAFGDIVVGRIAQQGLYDQNRLAVYAVILRSILDAPLLGYGYGTFADVFPMLRDQSVAALFKWEYAHNSYLEVLQGLGLPFGLMLIVCLAILVGSCVKAAFTQVNCRTIPAIASAVAVLVGVHALVDFSLQIQAVTLTFIALLGSGVAQVHSSGQPFTIGTNLRHTSGP
jgi:O-antigen ligase